MSPPTQCAPVASTACLASGQTEGAHGARSATGVFGAQHKPINPGISPLSIGGYGSTTSATPTLRQQEGLRTAGALKGGYYEDELDRSEDGPRTGHEEDVAPLVKEISLKDLGCDSEGQTETPIGALTSKKLSREERDENSGSRGDRSSQRSEEKGRRGGAASEGEQASVLGKRRRHDPLEEDKRPGGSHRKRSKRLREAGAYEGSSSRGRRREDKWDKLLVFLEREETRLYKDVADGKTTRGEKETEDTVRSFRREAKQARSGQEPGAMAALRLLNRK